MPTFAAIASLGSVEPVEHSDAAATIVVMVDGRLSIFRLVRWSGDVPVVEVVGDVSADDVGRMLVAFDAGRSPSWLADVCGVVLDHLVREASLHGNDRARELASKASAAVLELAREARD